MKPDNQTFYTDVNIHKGKILYRGYQNGKRIQDRFNYEPYLFLKSNKHTGFKTVDGQNVEQRFFDSISQAKTYLYSNKDITGFEYWGMTNFEYAYINDEFKGKIEFDRSLISIISLDIETYINHDAIYSINDSNFVKATEHEVNAITIRHNGKAYVFGTKYYKVKSDDVSYYLCKDERELLYKFLEVWQDIDPDVVTGWHINQFDIPYLINRIANTISIETSARLSPWFLIQSKDVENDWGDTNQIWEIKGVSILDYEELYKKFYPSKQESYKLDYIASVELGERKTDYSAYKGLNDLYDKNFELFIDYNINDAVLIDKLDAKLGYLNIAFCLAYLYKCNYKDAFGTVKPWDVCIHYFLLDKKQVIPSFEIPENIRPFEGGFVVDTVPGIYHWLLTMDIKSSYPHQIMSYNISPETYLGKIGRLSVDQLVAGSLEPFREQIIERKLSVAGNLTCYRKDVKGFMPEIMESFFAQRAIYQEEFKKLENETNGKTIDLKTKNHMASLDAMQYALKIAINAFYGMLSNPYCRWYSVDMAEAITLSGQLAVKWVCKEINEFLNKVLGTTGVDYQVAGDTDSGYFTLKGIVDKLGISDKKEIVKAIETLYNKHLSRVIKEAFEKLHVYMNSYQNKIRMARENIADRGIWTGKKHYVLNVLNKEGINYTEPKLKFVGLETNRSSTPMICKDYMKKTIKLIMTATEDDVHKFIAECKDDFFKRSFAEIATPGTANNLKKYTSASNIYSKGTPFHIRGALVYNHYLQKLGLDKLPQVKSGEKIRICYLRLPNPIFENVIAAPDELPDEIKLDQFIDYQAQFDKTFINPMESILKAINWSSNKVATLDDIFGFSF